MNSALPAVPDNGFAISGMTGFLGLEHPIAATFPLRRSKALATTGWVVLEKPP